LGYWTEGNTDKVNDNGKIFVKTCVQHGAFTSSRGRRTVQFHGTVEGPSSFLQRRYLLCESKEVWRASFAASFTHFMRLSPMKYLWEFLQMRYRAISFG
jgi:hypothetical protein